ncbi:MAG: pyridoxamine 5'-phosphate oxidase family protein [Chloroflexota bacterium]|nr:pyridoxamine 5'-phosphate oxidase family protein [Chloroflexota bacterium]MDE2685374.1 pyridoxamine 5'-phosphate oxidase family protein [Chloroflexota bacterium]
MIQLTEEMARLINHARDDGYPCIVGTASGDGTPNCGYIGTVLTVGDDRLIYRDRTGRVPLDHIEENPKVIVLFRNTEQDVGWKFRCTAGVYRDGPVFEEMIDLLLESGLIAERHLPDGSQGTIVSLRIDQVLTLFGEVLQERESGLQW